MSEKTIPCFDSIESFIIEVVSDFGIKGAQSTSEFRKDLGADSLDLVEVIMHIEDEYNIEMEISEFPKDFTIRYVTELTQEKIFDKVISRYDTLKG